MNKRVNDIRRVILAVCYFFAILSLLGTELPWLKITQSKPQTTIYIIDSPTCANKTGTTTTVAPTNTTTTVAPSSRRLIGSGAPNIYPLQFTLNIYMTLTASQLCQTFKNGAYLPYPIDAHLNDIRMCTDVSFTGTYGIKNFMPDVDGKSWNSYAQDCDSAGAGAMAMVILALIIMTITIIINTFPKSVEKCCEDQESFKNKFSRTLIAFFAPCFMTIALVIYSMQCLTHNDIANVLTTRDMTRSATVGYFCAAISCTLAWIYWLLFIFRMCDNSAPAVHVPHVDFKGASGLTKKFLKKKKKDSVDVDAGMISEQQEQDETQNAYSKYDDNDMDNRKVSAYDDDNTPAGSWKDVEED